MTDYRLMGLVKLMRMAVEGADLTPLGVQLIERAGLEPDNAEILMDLSVVLLLRGDGEIAMDVQAQALLMQQVYRLPVAEPSVRLLAIMGPGDLMANSPVEFLLEGSDVDLTLLYMSEDLPIPDSIPEHDLVFVAVAESDENIPLLQKISNFLEPWPKPVLNLPQKISRLSRDEVCALLSEPSIPGIEMPVSVRVDRGLLQQIAGDSLSVKAVLAGDDFPIIVRPVDSHAGKGLARLENGSDLAAYLSDMPQQAFFISRFVDYRSADGQFRKYRIVLMEGRAYLCHLAISSNWMIHYLNAGMSESAEKRAEEAQVMDRFDETFALRHAGALKEIGERVGLDYVGLDCAETRDGKLLIFEVDSCMIVHAIDPVDVFPYKQGQMRKVFGAFRQLLLNAVTRGPD